MNLQGLKALKHCSTESQFNKLVLTRRGGDSFILKC